MKLFKQIDLFISISLIIVFTILVLQTEHFGLVYNNFNLLITGYFVVGGWQVISMLVHVFARKFVQKSKIRVIYHGIVLIVITLGLSIFIIPEFGLLILFLLLYTAPFMAVFYTFICYYELRNINKVPKSIESDAK